MSPGPDPSRSGAPPRTAGPDPPVADPCPGRRTSCSGRPRGPELPRMTALTSVGPVQDRRTERSLPVDRRRIPDPTGTFGLLAEQTHALHILSQFPQQDLGKSGLPPVA